MIIRAAEPRDAPAVARLVRAAFSARPRLDPPATALSETPATVAAEIAHRGGLVAELDGALIGSLLFGAGPGLRLTRVCTDPAARRHGVAAALVAAAEVEAARRGIPLISLVARRELTQNITFWTALGYAPVATAVFPAVDRLPHNLVLARATPVALEVPGPKAMRVLGETVAGLLRAGDLVLLAGELGAGKTTLTQGIGAGLGVRGPVTSPTFVIAREHPSRRGGPGLLHVDAYRLGGPAELDDLDLVSPDAAAVTVVEWGRGTAESLAHERLEIDIEVPPTGDGPRPVRVRSFGGGWALRGLEELRRLQPVLDRVAADEAAAGAADEGSDGVPDEGSDGSSVEASGRVDAGRVAAGVVPAAAAHRVDVPGRT